MSSKSVTMKIKEGNALVDFYPKTTMENVHGLEEELAGIQGSDYSEVYQKAQSALNKANELDTVLKFPMEPVVRSDSNEFVYDGTMKAPTFSYLDTQRCVVSGTTQAINAGNYSAIFTPRYSSFTWSDTQNSDPRVINWSIAKKASTTTIDDSDFTLDATNLSRTITIDTDGDGTLAVTSSDTSVATVSFSGNTITVTGINDGTATITVTLNDGTNYTGGSWTMTCTMVTVLPLAQATPEMIQHVAQMDLARNYWAIGDWFPMTLNGNWVCTDNTITLNNYVCRCVLIGINHNAEKEGNHLLHFQMGKNTDGVDIAFYYSKMHTSNTNSGGWQACAMRNTTMANLYNTIIPEKWRNVIKTCIKYTDNTGGGSDNASYVTATEDKCFLLAEFEVFGSRTYANSAEQNYQKHYEYYANGNSKVRYRHDSPTNTSRSIFQRSSSKMSGGGAHGSYAAGTYNCTTAASGSTWSEWAAEPNYLPSFSPCFCIG